MSLHRFAFSRSLADLVSAFRDAHRALEATVEKWVLLLLTRLLDTAKLFLHSLMTEMSKGGNVATTSPAVDRRESLTDTSLRREVDELKTQLKEVEKRSEREIMALNQEVGFVALSLRRFAC